MDTMTGWSDSRRWWSMSQQQYMRGTPASSHVLLVTSSIRDSPNGFLRSWNNSCREFPKDRAKMSCNIRWTSKLLVKNFVFFTRFWDQKFFLLHYKILSYYECFVWLPSVMKYYWEKFWPELCGDGETWSVWAGEVPWPAWRPPSSPAPSRPSWSPSWSRGHPSTSGRFCPGSQRTTESLAEFNKNWHWVKKGS